MVSNGPINGPRVEPQKHGGVPDWIEFYGIGNYPHRLIELVSLVYGICSSSYFHCMCTCVPVRIVALGL